jgi:hypothetical protein
MAINTIKLFVIALVFTSVVSANAQSYSPFDTTNISWNEFYETEDPVNISFMDYFVSGDTIIGNYRYHKIFQTYNYDTKYVGAFRESNKVVLYIGMDYWWFDTDTSVILYDFTKNIGDTVYTGKFHRNIIVEIDSIPVSEGYRKRFKTDYGEDWIEGIGSTRGFLFPMTMIPTMFWHTELVCFKHNEDVIYLNPDFLDCTTRIVSSVNDAGVENTLEVYPNPAEREGIVSIKTKDMTITKTQLYNQLGILLATTNCLEKKEIQINMRDYAPGIYILLVFKSNQDITKMKIVVK